MATNKNSMPSGTQASGHGPAQASMRMSEESLRMKSQADWIRAGAEILRPLGGQLPPIRTPLMFRLSAILSAAVLLLLMVSYAALMLLAIWFVADYLLGHLRVLVEGAPVGSVIGYILLGVAVLLLLLLLVKPALHVRQDTMDLLELNPDAHPLIFAYIQQLCKALHTPAPSKISVVTGPTAAAGLKGFFGRASHPKLQLVLGLSLIAGMNLQEFSAVLAHELGHFARHRSSRVLGIINRVNTWFVRAVYEQDRFDYWLSRHSRGPWPVLRLPLLLAQLVMTLGRKLLWGFMMLGHLASSMVSRLNEFGSDQYAARISGSAVSAQALQRTVVLSLAQQAVSADIQDAWRENRLPDDLPQVIVAKARYLREDERQRMMKTVLSTKTGWLDTHPSLADRIAALEDLGVTGAVSSQQPASVLLGDFPEICRKATLALYMHLLKDDFAQAAIVPSETVVQENAQLEEARRALRRYYQGEVLLVRPVFPSHDASVPPADAHQAQADLATARNSMFDSREQLQQMMGRFAHTRQLEHLVLEVQTVLAAGLQAPPQPQLGLQQVTPQTVSARLADIRSLRSACQQVLAPLEAVARKRMTAALQLMRAPGSPVHGTAPLAHVDRLLSAARALQDADDKLDFVVNSTRTLVTLLKLQHSHPSTSTLRHYLSIQSQAVRTSLAALQESLREADYPFEHARGNVTLADYLVKNVPPSNEPAQLAMMGMEALERMDGLVWRVLAQLAKTTEQVESALGLPAREEPRQPHPSTDEPVRRPLRPTKAPAAKQVAMAGSAYLILHVAAHCLFAAFHSYSILPKHDYYRPTIVSSNWTPPPGADVWHLGVQPYKPGMTGYDPAGPYGTTIPGMPRMISTDPWGRQLKPGWSGDPSQMRNNPDHGYNWGRNPSPYEPGALTPGYNPGYQPGGASGGRPLDNPSRTYQFAPGYQPSPGYQSPSPSHYSPSPSFGASGGSSHSSGSPSGGGGSRR